ncbi:hypothetical protein PS652_04182 [Pseudomonas fluorescens]|uniref:Uncharacterized protein n=2 Tax=Pseudomonas TaxID=286 RepID=A0A5E6XH54_PSEFL|nr:hypothetical protein PS652_05366 [Pseudomonas fluorescens]
MTYRKAVRLLPSNPHSALRCPARPMPAQYAAPRHLSDQQLKNPLIRSAYERLSNMVGYRGQYLRRLDTVHGDRRTRVEKFQVIERVAEQLLVRLDLATGILGYIDPEAGRYVLNTQRKIAEDSEGVSAPVLCRLFKTLDDAGYVYRRIERIRLDEKDEGGLHLVRTRVLIRFTKLFWKDLGLLHVFERVQNSARKRRQVQLNVIGQRRLDDMERHSKELLRREVSRNRWRAKESRESDDLPASVRRPSDEGPSRPQAVTGNQVTDRLSKLLANVAVKASG